MDKSSYKNAELLLAVVIISRATSLLIIKSSLGDFQTFNLMALRFGIASICLIPFVRRKMSKITGGCLIHGIILGILFYTIIAVEIRGLRMTDSSAMVAFLENTAIVLVPLAEAVIHRRMPHRQNLVCAVLALSGVGFLLMKGGRFELTTGAAVCMMTAMLYTAYIIMNDSRKLRNYR